MDVARGFSPANMIHNALSKRNRRKPAAFADEPIDRRFACAGQRFWSHSVTERRQLETASERTARRKRDLERAHTIDDSRFTALAAAAGARGSGEQRRQRHDCGDPQPVHPIRRMPPKADWLRYDSSNRFVPQASHFASMIWSQPPEPRKKTSPTCQVLAKPSIASAFGL